MYCLHGVQQHKCTVFYFQKMHRTFVILQYLAQVKNNYCQNGTKSDNVIFKVFPIEIDISTILYFKFTFI